MNRRTFVADLAKGSALAALFGHSGGLRAAEPAPPSVASAGGSPLKIKNVRAILTMPGRTRLCVVKVETSEPGLVGFGCATFTQRIRTVATAVEQYLAPFLA